jgi:hypothetical protein
LPQVVNIVLALLKQIVMTDEEGYHLLCTEIKTQTNG